MEIHTHKYIKSGKYILKTHLGIKEGLIVHENIIYTTRAICHTHKLNTDTINEMVSWGIAEPKGNNPDNWQFTQHDYERIERALRFRKELEINIPGAALTLNLLEEIQNLRNKEY